jgi:acyl-coenzyme A synthetase/AMP-(fatty) acid ligase
MDPQTWHDWCEAYGTNTQRNPIKESCHADVQKTRYSDFDICVLIYIGGTTSKPKGVIHTHRVHVAMVMSELAEWDWPEEVRFLAMTPARLVEGMRVFGPVFMRLYGQSEVPNCITVLRKIDYDPDNHPQRLASCGSPIGGIQVKLLDDDGVEVSVGEVGVIGVPDAKWGEAVKALVVLRKGASVSAEELIALVRQAKGAVQAPKSVEFVERLPVTGLGKPDKKAIRAKYWQGQQCAVH